MKRKKKNMMAQAMAWLALFAIVIGIVGTWFAVLFSGWESAWYGHSQTGGEEVQNLSQEDLQRLIDESSIEVNGEAVEVSTREINITASGAAQ